MGPRPPAGEPIADTTSASSKSVAPAFGYRRVQWWLKHVGGLRVNRKRVLRVMRDRGLLLRSRRFQVSRRKDWSTVEASHPNLVWPSDMTKLWAGPATGWAYLVSVLANTV